MGGDSGKAGMLGALGLGLLGAATGGFGIPAALGAAAGAGAGAAGGTAGSALGGGLASLLGPSEFTAAVAGDAMLPGLMGVGGGGAGAGLGSAAGMMAGNLANNAGAMGQAAMMAGADQPPDQSAPPQRPMMPPQENPSFGQIQQQYGAPQMPANGLLGAGDPQEEKRLALLKGMGILR